MYRFLQNDRVSEEDIIKNMSLNCISCVGNRPVLCIQGTSDVNLYNHKNRIRKDDYIGTTNAKERKQTGYSRESRNFLNISLASLCKVLKEIMFNDAGNNY